MLLLKARKPIVDQSWNGQRPEWENGLVVDGENVSRQWQERESLSPQSLQSLLVKRACEPPYLSF